MTKPPTATLSLRGVEVPTFIYGTAWKEDETSRLTSMALDSGFRGVDTANQRRHYFEEGVGNALKAALSSGAMTRQQLFIQTKFTYQAGQDHRLPYDPNAPLPEQVLQSFRSSLEHLGVDVIDCYVLHGPALRQGLTDEDWQVWSAMEKLHEAGGARLLGISNVTLEQLDALRTHATVTPAVVQNRCYAVTGWDHGVRKYCSDHGMRYQGFSLLTANRDILAHPLLRQVASRVGATPSQVIFRFALQVGMLALTGTTSQEHMREDLKVYDIQLEPEEVEGIERIAVPGSA